METSQNLTQSAFQTQRHGSHNNNDTEHNGNQAKETDQKVIQENSVTYLESLKELNRIKNRMTYLDDMHSKTLENITRLYRTIGSAEAKMRWRLDIDEQTNPVDLNFFLHENQDEFFDPNQEQKTDEYISEMKREKESLSKIEQELRELRVEYTKLAPLFVPKAKKPKKPKPSTAK